MDKKKDIKLSIIENFILNFTSSEREREYMAKAAYNYVNEDEGDELNDVEVEPYNFHAIDWEELRDQKLSLQLIQNDVKGEKNESIEGILNLIDSIQDYACDVLGIEEEKVFGEHFGKKILVCENCGSDNVQVLAWVDANTNEYADEAACGDINDYYCTKCEKNVKLTFKNI